MNVFKIFGTAVYLLVYYRYVRVPTLRMAKSYSSLFSYSGTSEWRTALNIATEGWLTGFMLQVFMNQAVANKLLLLTHLISIPKPNKLRLKLICKVIHCAAVNKSSLLQLERCGDFLLLPKMHRICVVNSKGKIYPQIRGRDWGVLDRILHLLLPSPWLLIHSFVPYLDDGASQQGKEDYAIDRQTAARYGSYFLLFFN